MRVKNQLVPTTEPPVPPAPGVGITISSNFSVEVTELKWFVALHV